MRVTENSLVNQFLYNIQDQYQQMDKLQRWISSGKTILSASDDRWPPGRF
jgi:flagellin-like hook-associated protein FlgL